MQTLDKLQGKRRRFAARQRSKFTRRLSKQLEQTCGQQRWRSHLRISPVLVFEDGKLARWSRRRIGSGSLAKKALVHWSPTDARRRSGERCLICFPVEQWMGASSNKPCVEFVLARGAATADGRSLRMNWSFFMWWLFWSSWSKRCSVLKLTCLMNAVFRGNRQLSLC